MMGSRGRSALVRRQLLEKGLEEKRVEALYAPIGLSIGSQTAEEIALSILAQVVSIKNARSQTEGFSSAILDAMAQADHTGQRAVLAVITARHGSTPREAGAKMLVLADGTVVGSVGGGIMGAPHDPGCAGNAGGKYSGTAADVFLGRWKRRRRCSRCLRRFDGNMVGHSAGRRGA